MDSHDIVILVVGLSSLLAALISYWNNRKLETIHLSLNSRLDALVAASSKAAYAAGHDAAQLAGSDKATELAKSVAEAARVLALLGKNEPIPVVLGKRSTVEAYNKPVEST